MNAEAVSKTILQWAAILCLVGVCSMVLHKAWVDVSAIAVKHTGGDFWAALARYLLKNLAG